MPGKPNPKAARGERVPKLKPELQLWVVQQLAAWQPCNEIAAELLKSHGVAISQQALGQYKSCEKWRETFREERRKWCAAVDEEPLANTRNRVQKWTALMEQAGKNIGLQAEILEKLAKDVGGTYTARREFTGADGAALLGNGVVIAASALLREIRGEEPVEPGPGAQRGDLPRGAR